MPTKKTISAAERRHRDELRLKTMRVSSVYETRLVKARRKELKRVLDMSLDYEDPLILVPLISGQIDETDYLGDWWVGLITEAGLPFAKATARDMRQAKAAGEDGVWLSFLRRFATERAGENITMVTGTWKESLVKIVRSVLESGVNGVEKVAKEVMRRYKGTIERWQCRRIAQTESMVGTAEAGDAAAKTLSVKFTKQWCISGLGNTRDSHLVMDGVVVDQDDPFVLKGGLMMYPHDTSMGADASEIINCACDCIRRPKR